MDTLFADVAGDYQVGVDDSYPYQFLSIRANDGNYRDKGIVHNLAWSKSRTDSGRLVGFMVYFVWEPNWQETVATFKALVGVPHARMAIMIDAETWGGRISGNQSAGLNAAREDLIRWLDSYKSWFTRMWHKITGQSSRRKVGGYANTGDFASMWPQRDPGMWVVLANYTSNPAFPGKVAHQFASNFTVPPFGPCDINSADGLTPAQFASAIGLGHVGSVTPATPFTLEEEDTMRMITPKGVVAKAVMLDGMHDAFVLENGDRDRFAATGVPVKPVDPAVYQWYRDRAVPFVPSGAQA